MKPKLRVSSSIAPFRPKAEKIWKLDRYRFPQDIFKPVVFFGLYHWADYSYYLAHRGHKTILWAGSDIVNLFNNELPWNKLFLNAKHYVENENERELLMEKDIKAEVRPSFLEDVNDFTVSYKHSDRPNVYLSARPGREIEYGVNLIEKIAHKVPEVKFHIYGVKKEMWHHINMPTKIHNTETPVNVVYYGNIHPEKFNEDIKYYQCGLRLNEHDGFSEITAKSILMGQYPITRIPYPNIDNYVSEEKLIILLKDLKNKKEPNLKAREWWISNLNNYPWTNE